MQEHLFKFFQREGDLSFWKFILIISIISGISNAGLLALINGAANTAKEEGLNYQYFAMYVVVFLIYFITKKYSMVKSAQKVEKIIKNTRARISNKVVLSDLVTIENLNKSEIFTRLTRDTDIISQAATILIGTTQSVIMIFFALVYIFFISKLVFFVIFFSLVLTIMIYETLSQELTQELDKSNAIENSFFKSLDAIVDGFKEIKMNSQKKQDILRNHHTILDTLLELKIYLSNKFTTSIMFTEIFLYILLGTIVFVIPHLATEESSTIIKSTAALLFIVGPLEASVSIFPLVAKTITSIKSIDDLETLLDTHRQNKDFSDENALANFGQFREIVFKDVAFHYDSITNEKIFGIGPIDFNFKRGEIVFIIGGNGSGKSTFIKTLLALYKAKSGNISLDGIVVDKYNEQIYRDLFSIILTDFYMFDAIHGIENIDHELLNDLLIEMQLNSKTKYINGKFTTTNLSTGQKKRLALVIAILEDKPILVLDEWAADQDPEFRKYFYETILIRLQKQGKTIIAVTHDDAYFKFSDKVLKMDYGKLSLYKGVM